MRDAIEEGDRRLLDEGISDGVAMASSRAAMFKHPTAFAAINH